jgi:hypothetical protein
MAKKTKVKAEQATEEKTVSKTFSLAQMARDNGKNEKAVRARFRKLYRCENPDPKLPKTAKDGSVWTFNETDREAVLALVLNVSTDE